jgi:hypothetical protein
VRAASATLLLLIALVAPVPAGAQAASPVETFVESILTYPASYHLREVVVYGTLRTETDQWWLESDEGPRILVTGDPAAVKAGRIELLAEVVDVGRLPESDPRLKNTPLQAMLIRRDVDRWPRPGELVVLSAQRAAVLKPAIRPSLRAVVLEAARFEDKIVTVVGQFRARNLFNDLPAEPGISKNDFVLKNGRAAVWVVGLRPRVNGVDLDLKSRAGTNDWFAVEGVVHRGKGLVWIDAAKMAAAPVPAEVLPATPAQAQALQEAPEVMFSVPAAEEADVAVATKIRIQYSRPIDPATLAGHVRAAYVSRTPGGSDEPAPSFVVDYATSDHVVTVRFTAPLERFRTVTVELGDGIATLHGTRATPWRLQFTTGGRAPHE